MLYAEYGKTGIAVSRLGFGGMRFKNDKDQDACADLVKACYDSGINYFDTAPGYGESEVVMGLAFKEMLKTRAAKPFYASSKTMAETPDEIRRECEKSLKRMQLPYLDFYHMWCITSLDDYRNRKAKNALDAFEKLKREGLVKHVVVSTHMEGSEVRTLMADYPFEGVLLGYSVMNFAFRDAGLTAAAASGQGTVVMNPLGGGIIPSNPERFDFVRSRPDETVVEAALRFLLNDRRITVALVGLSSREQLKEALSAVDGFKTLSDREVERIRKGLSKAFDSMCTGCGYCDNCPQGLPIPKLMDAYNQFMLTGKKKKIGERLYYHWDILYEGHNLDQCTECGLCEKSCTQKLPIISRLKEVEAARAEYASMA